MNLSYGKVVIIFFVLFLIFRIIGGLTEIYILERLSDFSLLIIFPGILFHWIFKCEKEDIIEKYKQKKILDSRIITKIRINARASVSVLIILLIMIIIGRGCSPSDPHHRSEWDERILP
jgi:hypothetical protein